MTAPARRTPTVLLHFEGVDASDVSAGLAAYSDLDDIDRLVAGLDALLA